jgi:hypothetical protein
VPGADSETNPSLSGNGFLATPGNCMALTTPKGKVDVFGYLGALCTRALLPG